MNGDNRLGDEALPAIEWLAEKMPGGFFIYYAEGDTELIYVNGAVCRIFGCDSVEEFKSLTGNTFRGMVHPDDYEVIQDSIDEQIADETNNNLDYVVYRIIRKDGTIRWVDDYGHYTYLPGYGNVYYVFIGDITDTRMVKEEQQRNRQLEEALHHAEAANMAKSAFLSNMSHEIRTPLTAILGMNELIQRECGDETIYSYAEKVRKAGVSLLRIISDILDFSKIESGRMELVEEGYSVRDLFADLYILIQFQSEEKALNTVFRIDPAIPSRLCGDEIRVKEVISNLLTNAVKYTEKGSVTLNAVLDEIKDGEAKICISVEDTGIGIREEDMDRLFEPFDRLDQRRNRAIKGTGLGLSITRQLLLMMGSSLKVESEYEKGSVFSFVLTQKIAENDPVGVFDPGNAVTEISDRRRIQTDFTAPGAGILVVDDTLINIEVIEGLLKNKKMKIDTASSGKECIEKFAKNDYDLIFLDYRMPELNGIETLQRMKEQMPEKTAGTPVISLTASAVSGEKERMLAAGFTDYLPKPVNITLMEKMLIRYLPKELVIFSDAAGVSADTANEEDRLPHLLFSSAEILPAKGLEYCGDADDYIRVLSLFKKSAEKRLADITESAARGDMDAYIMSVHTLKSTSGAIGALQLSRMAGDLEKAAKSGNRDFVEKETPLLAAKLKMLKFLLDEIEEI